MEIDKAKLLAMYKSMVRIRAFEKRASKEFALGNIPGHIHLSVGQEAVAVGACANLVDGDYITSTHRGHGHVIAKGWLSSSVRKMGITRGRAVQCILPT